MQITKSINQYKSHSLFVGKTYIKIQLSCRGAFGANIRRVSSNCVPYSRLTKTSQLESSSKTGDISTTWNSMRFGRLDYQWTWRWLLGLYVCRFGLWCMAGQCARQYLFPTTQIQASWFGRFLELQLAWDRCLRFSCYVRLYFGWDQSRFYAFCGPFTRYYDIFCTYVDVATL